MVNLYGKFCIDPSCKPLSASYGFEGGAIEYCAKHKLPGMILVSHKKCPGSDEHPKCGREPSFGYPGGHAEYCSECCLDGMEDVRHKKCEQCKKITARFGYEDESPTRCKDHAKAGMFDVTALRCTECKTTAGFNIPGSKPNKCATHRTSGMIADPTKRCEFKKCKEPATHGISKHIHCEKHKEKDERNLIERDCESCGLLMILNEKNLCGFCDPAMIKNVRLAKQKQIKQLFDNKKLKYTIYDQTVDRSCGLERPDFVFDCGDHFVVVEVDEDAHKGKTTKCEQVRMFNISQALGLKVIFIRYNPDPYKNNCKRENPANSTRHTQLIKTINIMRAKRNEDIDFLSVVHLYYDGYNGKDIQLNAIHLNELTK